MLSGSHLLLRAACIKSAASPSLEYVILSLDTVEFRTRK